ncbi:hypothetical protein ACE01N_08580 [Saccharicrinis sp. FJH2]|uniref:hypothetical protein n=1 Tax=unclassified Saccharicrinis TaxID=2646859 RepID=UPI0035D4C81F
MKLKIFMLVVLMVLIAACTEKEPIGKWGDIIKLSTKSLNFSSNGDSATVTTEGDWWWITDVAVDTVWFYHFDVNQEYVSEYVIQDSCFYLERKDARSLFIKIDPNPTNSNRIIRIGLEAGDYFDGITITQEGK